MHWHETGILFSEGETADGLFILDSGEAALTMTSIRGEVIICVQAKSGSLLGLPSVVDNVPYSLTATVRGGSVLRFIPRKEFESLLSSNPTLSLSMLQVLAAEVRAARLAIAES